MHRLKTPRNPKLCMLNANYSPWCCRASQRTQNKIMRFKSTLHERYIYTYAQECFYGQIPTISSCQEASVHQRLLLRRLAIISCISPIASRKESAWGLAGNFDKIFSKAVLGMP